MLNRSAIIVRPKKPYIDWAARFEDAGSPFKEDDRIVYLLPEYYDDKEALETLERAFDMIFEAELMGWHTKVEDWPQDRTFATFKKWFTVEKHSLVQDLCGDPMEDDEIDQD